MEPWQPTQADVDMLVQAGLIGWALAVQFVVAMMLIIRWSGRRR